MKTPTVIVRHRWLDDLRNEAIAHLVEASDVSQSLTVDALPLASSEGMEPEPRDDANRSILVTLGMTVGAIGAMQPCAAIAETW